MATRQQTAPNPLSARRISPVVEPQSDALPGLLGHVPSLYTVATLAVLSAIFIIALMPNVETDFFWHLKVGQYIANHHVVPSRDFMSFTFVGHPWTDHEWLAELGLYGLYQMAGLWGPIVFFALVITVAFTFVLLVMRQRGVHPVLALFVLSAAFTASRGSWGPRIQMLSLVFVSVYMFVLHRYALTRDRRLLFAFPALMLIWTNVHAGFALGLVVLGAALVGETLNRLTRQEDSWDVAHIRMLGFALAGTFAITIINPNGVRQLLYPLTFVLPNAFTNQIQESASPNFHELIMVIFEALLLLLIISVFVGRPRLNWTNLLFAVGFTHLALSQVRNVALWMVVVTPILAVYLQGTGPVIRSFFPHMAYRRRPVRGKLAPVLNLVLLGLVLVLYIAEAHTYINQKALDRSVQTNFPIAAVKYLKTHVLPPRVYVSYAWGGYFLWNLSPTYRDFMDSRADTLYNSRILNDYLALYGAHPGWKTLIDRYRIQDVLVEPAAPISQFLQSDSGWKRVYHDSGAVLFTRRQP